MSKKQQIQEINRESLTKEIKRLKCWVESIDPDVKTSKDAELRHELKELIVQAGVLALSLE